MKREVEQLQKVESCVTCMAAKRTFEHALSLIADMTGRAPNRCPENILVTKRLITALGLEGALNNLKFIHVAGTKGKGTTCVYTSALLHHCYSANVGLFLSPHVLDIRERIQINNEKISKEIFTKCFFDIYSRYEEVAHGSESEFLKGVASRSNFFRFMFMVALHTFEHLHVDFAVLEVGIGGRLDSTNVISKPVVCGITSLGMDHMEILGSTIEKIAEEKAGIFKDNVVCFSVPQTVHPSTRKVLMREASKAKTPLVFLDAPVLKVKHWPQMAIGGEHNKENATMAVALSRMATGSIIPAALSLKEYQTLSQVTFVGRSHVIHLTDRVSFFVDGAHTPESMTASLVWFFSKARSPARKVVIFYTTREALPMMKPFLPYYERIDKLIIGLVRNPKTRSCRDEGDSGDLAAAEDRGNQVRYVEQWRSLFPEVPCHPFREPFESIQQVLDVVIKVEPKQWRTGSNNPAAGQVGETLSAPTRNCVATDIEEETTKNISEVAAADKPVDVLVVGSLFLAGDILKLIYEETQQPI